MRPPKPTKEHPILFSGPMVRAILDGTKTQTRRPVSVKTRNYPNAPTPTADRWTIFPSKVGGYCAIQQEEQLLDQETRDRLAGMEGFLCPFGVIGDRLWVKEAFVRHVSIPELHGYCADGCTVTEEFQRKVSKSKCPRWASRLTLEITDIRVERLQDISEEDAKAEGAWVPNGNEEWAMPFRQSYRMNFVTIWDDAYGEGSWDSNPWVWAITFKKVMQ